MEKLKRTIEGFAWTFIVTLFGLLNIVVLLIHDSNSSLQIFDTKATIIEAGLLFFCASIATSVAVDCFFLHKISFSNKFYGLALFLPCLALVTYASLTYLTLKLDRITVESVTAE